MCQNFLITDKVIGGMLDNGAFIMASARSRIGKNLAKAAELQFYVEALALKSAERGNAHDEEEDAELTGNDLRKLTRLKNGEHRYYRDLSADRRRANESRSRERSKARR